MHHQARDRHRNPHRKRCLSLFAKKASASVGLIDQMAKEIPAVGACVANATKEQVLAALDTDLLGLRRGRQDILVSGAGRVTGPLFGARMPLQ